jgi:hypothetical protein
MNINRNTTIDLIRGMVLLLMSYHHIGLYFESISTYFRYSFQFFGYFSFAEIFFAISAYSILGSSSDEAGKIFPFEVLKRKAIKRFLKIYFAQILSLLLVLILSLDFNWHFDGMANQSRLNRVSSFFLGSLLLFQPTLLDILPLYLIFTGLTPFFLNLLGNQHTFKVLFASFLLWVLAQTLLPTGNRTYINGIVTPGLGVLSWQLFYFYALTVFYYKDKFLKLKFIFIPLTLVLTLLFFLLKHNFIPFNIDYFIDRQNMGILRALNALSAVVLFMLVAESNFISSFHIRNRGLKRLIGVIRSMFVWIGQNALNLFAIHIPIFYYVGFYGKSWIKLYPPIYHWIFCLILILLPIPVLKILQSIRLRLRT